MQVKIQQWGNSGAVRLNKDLLQLMSVEVGGVLEVEVKDNTLMLRPSSPEYALDELLAASPKATFALADEDKEWLDAAPAGKERI